MSLTAQEIDKIVKEMPSVLDGENRYHIKTAEEKKELKEMFEIFEQGYASAKCPESYQNGYTDGYSVGYAVAYEVFCGSKNALP